MVKDKQDKGVGALKIISKERIIKTKQVEHTIGEKVRAVVSAEVRGDNARPRCGVFVRVRVCSHRANAV